MRALVTGSAGFIGRHFAAELEQRGYAVTWCDSAYPVNEVPEALELFRTDGTRYDLVVHAAARAPHRAAIDSQPAGHVYNQLLDAAMFDWAIRTGQGRVLYLSSCAAYPACWQDAGNHVPILEDWAHPPDPVDSYAWTKLTGERMAVSARAAGLPVTVVRPFSGYGEGQSADFPFTAIIERARRDDNPFEIWGDGSQVRDWIHVDDVVASALAVVESGAEEPVNLCTGRGVSMLELARYACLESGQPGPPEWRFRLDKPAGVAYRVGNPARLHRYYTPQITLEEGVKRALAGG